MAARWNLVVSEQTDTDLRQHLASQGKGRKGEMSKFVEETVRRRILDEQVESMKQATAHMSEAEIAELVDEAIAWARTQRVIRVVLDTNILLGALISKRGAPHRLYLAWQEKRFEVVTCEEQQEEFQRVSRYPKLREAVRASDAGYIANQLARARGFDLAGAPHDLRDPDDGWMLELARLADAQYLVTGDKRAGLLARRQVGGARILTAADLCEEAL